MLVEEAQQVITGIEPQQLRDSVRLRQMVARDFEQIQASVGEMLVIRRFKTGHSSALENRPPCGGYWVEESS